MNRKSIRFLLAMALILTMLMGCVPCAFAESAMTPGTYTATCRGFYGDFDVTVTVDDQSIVSIEPGAYQETEGVGGVAIAMMIDRMTNSNTAGVDLVSGATVSSAVFRAAVMDCLKQAGAPESLMQAVQAPAVSEQTIGTDILVIGSGGAGYSAAISAATAGAKVTLIEKQDIVGGSTIVSAGIVYGALDEDDVPAMVDYYIERADGNADREMLTTFAENSLDTLAALEDAGVQWMMAVPTGTAPQPRGRFAFHADTGVAMIGSALIQPLNAKAESVGVEVLTGVKATELITEGDAVVGAKATSKSANYTINAKAVIIATGGYDASAEMLATYSPIASGDIILSNHGNVGEGLTMGLAVGAATEFKGGIIGFQAVNQGLPGSGCSPSAMQAPLYVKQDGEFVCVGADYPINYTNLKASGVNDFYAIYDAAGEGTSMPAIEAGFGFTADTLEELAAAAGMDVAKLTEAVAQNEALTTAPYFANVVRPATIGSMGGLKTNTSAQVLSEATGEPIVGLYAAGEVANAAFYYMEYPASGSSNAISMTFGRIAGAHAAAEIAK